MCPQQTDVTWKHNLETAGDRTQKCIKTHVYSLMCRWIVKQTKANGQGKHLIECVDRHTSWLLGETWKQEKNTICYHSLIQTETQTHYHHVLRGTLTYGAGFSDNSLRDPLQTVVCLDSQWGKSLSISKGSFYRESKCKACQDCFKGTQNCI